jgi:hypothetical protein
VSSFSEEKEAKRLLSLVRVGILAWTRIRKIRLSRYYGQAGSRVGFSPQFSCKTKPAVWITRAQAASLG